ncbi:MAG: DUF3303 family protein [Fulvivirga sp.]
MQKYMVVEKFKSGCFDKCNSRWHSKGRMLPEGLYYLHSWVNKEQNICFQLMETNDQQLFEIWIKNWDDYIDFDIFPID